MTSKLTREENVQAVFDLKAGYTLGLADVEILKRVARMALAAMDSEPVAVIDLANLDYLLSGADADVWPPEREEMGDVLLYRHAQPAPVVLDEMLCEFYEVANWPDLVRELVKHIEQLQDSAKRNVKPWEDTFPATLLPAYIDRIKQADDACRAAMLQAGTLTNEDARQVDELTMWIKRLVRSLKNANSDSKLPREAMDYLTAKGLISVGDILR